MDAMEAIKKRCSVRGYKGRQVKEILGIPGDIRVVELLTLGYPDKPCSGYKDRLSLEEILMQEEWK